MIVTDDKAKLNELSKQKERDLETQDDVLPPPYHAPVEDHPAPVNLLRVYRRSNAIRGRWRVDTSLEIPESLLEPSPEKEGIRPNLHLETRDGSIEADVKLEGTKRARIVLDTRDGNVRVGVNSSSPQTLSIKAVTRDGTVTVILPQHFSGPISYSTKDGRAIFSPAVQARLTMFVDSRREGKAFIGDPKAYLEEHKAFSAEQKDSNATERPQPVWDGDEVEARTNDGNLRFFFQGEEVPDLMSEVLLKKIKSWVGY